MFYITLKVCTKRLIDCRLYFINFIMDINHEYNMYSFFVSSDWSDQFSVSEAAVVVSVFCSAGFLSSLVCAGLVSAGFAASAGLFSAGLVSAGFTAAGCSVFAGSVFAAGCAGLVSAGFAVSVFAGSAAFVSSVFAAAGWVFCVSAASDLFSVG